MTELSRRQFLQFSGVVALRHALKFDIPDTPHYARAFAATPIHQTPDGPISGHLWPDSISRLLSVDDHWYQIEQGFVKRTELQPISYDPLESSPSLVQPLTWVTPYIPCAVIREWCAPDAPLVTRIGHGGVMAVVDYLPGDPDWYAMGYADGEPIGWSQALHWRALQPQNKNLDDLHLVVKNPELTIYRHGYALSQTRIATHAEALPFGDYAVTRSQPGGPLAGYEGVPWLFNIGNQMTLGGVYWHNNFGQQEVGPTIQTIPVVAQWLYTHVGQDTHLSIIS